MDGNSSWMKGVMLLGAYVIVGISYWLYPEIDAKALAGVVLARIRRPARWPVTGVVISVSMDLRTSLLN